MGCYLNKSRPAGIAPRPGEIFDRDDSIIGSGFGVAGLDAYPVKNKCDRSSCHVRTFIGRWTKEKGGRLAGVHKLPDAELKTAK